MARIGVFIAHAGPDAALARELFDACRRAGLDPFLDAELPPGEQWDLALPEAQRRAERTEAWLSASSAEVRRRPMPGLRHPGPFGWSSRANVDSWSAGASEARANHEVVGGRDEVAEIGRRLGGRPDDDALRRAVRATCSSTGA